MKKIAMLIAALVLAACSTTPANPADVLGKACPIVQGTILTLGVTEGISDKTKDRLKEVEPMIVTACAVTPETADIGIGVLVTHAVPLLMDAINDSDLKDDKKQAALVTLVVVQVMLAGVSP